MFNRDALTNCDWIPEQIDALEDCISQLDDQVMDQLVVPNAETGFRVPNMMRAQSQSFIIRELELANSIVSLANQQNWLSIVIVCRALIETIASYTHFTKRLASLVESGDVQAIHDFSHSVSFGTRLTHLADQVEDMNVIVTNILTQVDAVLDLNGNGIRENYNHLSEYCHPNTFGTFSFFGQHDNDTDTIIFSRKGHYPNEAFYWVFNTFGLLYQTLIFKLTIDDLANEVAVSETEISK